MLTGKTFSGLIIDWKSNINPPITVGKIANFDIQTKRGAGWADYDYIQYALFDTKKNKYVMVVQLCSFDSGSKGLEVLLVGVALPYQGMNLSVKLYAWLILKKNIILLSGEIQSPGGRSIWERLAMVPGVFIFGYDKSRRKSFQIDQRDLFNEDVYTDDLQKEYDELEKEHDRLDMQAYDLDYENPNYKIIRKKMYDLQEKMDKVYNAVVTAEKIQLVAIKRKGK